MEALGEYFKKGTKGAVDTQYGVALEGGGNKSAPFALGVLAGLQSAGVLEKQVGAISSVSGGSYAASYYFNRLLDRYGPKPDLDPEKVREREKYLGNADAWFKSCIPAYYANRYQILANPKQICKENPDSYDEEFSFIEHVWQNVDLMNGAFEGSLDNSDNLSFPEFLQYIRLASYSLMTSPLSTVDRVAFRLPFNVSPTKLEYKLGLERQYGYSPYDWAQLHNPVAHAYDTIRERRPSRTLAALGNVVNGQSAAPL